MMRLMYIGQDGRTRVAIVSRVKFLEDGFKVTDKYGDPDGVVSGPVLVVHSYRSKGAKRLIVSVPESYNMGRAQFQLLEKGWLDITECTVVMENLY